jgi:FkbM family methyltransferase
LKTIGGHTFDETLLADGVIIDVGCRDFEFAKYFIEQGKEIYCIDPDSSVFEIAPQNIGIINVAISDKAGDSGIYLNGEGTCLKEIDPDQTHPFVPCKTMTMDDVYYCTIPDGAPFETVNVDILKLDCEGAEYVILGETFKPIPKQISVEFHYHCVPELHTKHFDSIMERLSKDYTIHNDVWEPRHGCGNNYWDILFIRKW